MFGHRSPCRKDRAPLKNSSSGRERGFRRNNTPSTRDPKQDPRRVLANPRARFSGSSVLSSEFHSSHNKTLVDGLSTRATHAHTDGINLDNVNHVLLSPRLLLKVKSKPLARDVDCVIAHRFRRCGSGCSAPLEAAVRSIGSLWVIWHVGDVRKYDPRV